MKKPNKNKHVDIENRVMGIRRKGVGWVLDKWIKGVNCRVIDDGNVFGGEHTVGYI